MDTVRYGASLWTVKIKAEYADQYRGFSGPLFYNVAVEYEKLGDKEATGYSSPCSVEKYIGEAIKGMEDAYKKAEIAPDKVMGESSPFLSSEDLSDSMLIFNHVETGDKLGEKDAQARVFANNVIKAMRNDSKYRAFKEMREPHTPHTPTSLPDLALDQL